MKPIGPGLSYELGGSKYFGNFPYIHVNAAGI